MEEYKYKPRVIDSLLSRKLRGKGAVLIEGAKWCGKTSTAEQQAKSIIICPILSFATNTVFL